MPPKAPDSAHIAHVLLTRAHSPTSTTRLFTEKIKQRPLYLKPTETPLSVNDARSQRRSARLRKEEARKRKTKPKPLSAREKRAMGIHDIPKSEQRYELYLGLHKLWMGYIQEILGIRSSTIAALGDAIANPTPNTFRGASTGTAAILTSADFHGAELEVVRSRCPSRVGLKGIVLRDSKFAFTLVTSKNEVKVCPKEHTVFRFRVEVPAWDDAGRNPEGDTTDEGDQKGSGKAVEERKLIFELHGEQFQHRAVDRANKKFKPHFLPDL